MILTITNIKDELMNASIVIICMIMKLAIL